MAMTPIGEALGLLNPLIAGAAMGFSSVSVVANALRLRRLRAQRNGGATATPTFAPIRDEVAA